MLVLVQENLLNRSKAKQNETAQRPLDLTSLVTLILMLTDIHTVAFHMCPPGSPADPHFAVGIVPQAGTVTALPALGVHWA